jgi:hypothetical protein
MRRKITRIFLITALSASAQSHLAEPRLLLPDNAYNPIPSPDGKFIAYVATGFGANKNGIHMGLGRASLHSDVGLLESSGKQVNASFVPDNFLAGWTADSQSLVSYRDWTYSILTLDGRTVETGKMPVASPSRNASERIAFLNDLRRPVWIAFDGTALSLQTGEQTRMPISNKGPTIYVEPVLVPSPNGRYIALMTWARRNWALWIYDRKLDQWANLGEAIISPDKDWDWLKPSWDPWFADSASLAYFTPAGLTISSPDGNNRRILFAPDRAGGLATPSPDGHSVAYVTLESRPMKSRPDIKYWGDTSVWVVSTKEGSTPRQITAIDPDMTSTLHWHGNNSLVFDRIRENIFDMHARMWEVAVP